MGLIQKLEREEAQLAERLAAVRTAISIILQVNGHAVVQGKLKGLEKKLQANSRTLRQQHATIESHLQKMGKTARTRRKGSKKMRTLDREGMSKTLAYLQQHGPLPIKALAEGLKITPANLAYRLGILKTDHYVRKTHDRPVRWEAVVSS